MNPEPHSPRRGISPNEIEEAAAQWVAHRDQGFTPTDESAFGAWMAADPRHRRAFCDSEQVWRALNRSRVAGRGATALRAIGRHRAARRRHWVRLAAASITCAVLVLGATYYSLRRPTFGTVTVEHAIIPRPDREILADGSVVDLNVNTELAVAFTAERREVRLLHGEAFFTVAHDTARPFIVTVDGVCVRAVGTAFAVRRAIDNVNVLVTEGRVAVERANDGRSLIEFEPAPDDAPAPTAAIASVFENKPVLTAGHRLVVAVADRLEPERAAPATVSNAEVGAALAWLQHRVEFTRTTLAEAVVLFNHENRVQLLLSDEATSELRISGIFWTDDPEGFSRLLVSSLGLRATRRSPDSIVLSK